MMPTQPQMTQCRQGMKLTKISLKSFRAFDEPLELELDGGKDLLHYGENGSGKSSIYFALKRFFEERGDDIAKHLDGRRR